MKLTNLIALKLPNVAPSLANFSAIKFDFKLPSNDDYFAFYSSIRYHFNSSIEPRKPMYKEKILDFYCESNPEYKWSIQYVGTQGKELINLTCLTLPKDHVNLVLKFVLYRGQNILLTNSHLMHSYHCGNTYEILNYPTPEDSRDMRVIVKMAFFINNQGLTKKIRELSSNSIMKYHSYLLSKKNEAQNDWGRTVVLKNNNKKFKAVVHQDHLDKFSPVLASMFQENFKEGIERSAVLPVGDGTFEEFLNFVYSGLPPPESADFNQMLYFADKYQIDILKEYSELQLISSASIDNVYRLMVAASECRAPLLKEVLSHFVVHFLLVGTPEWEKFAEDNPHVVNDTLETITTSGFV